MRVCDFCMKPGNLKEVILPVIERWDVECAGKKLDTPIEKVNICRCEICSSCKETLAKIIDNFKVGLQGGKNN